jgi:hypothetical protein
MINMAQRLSIKVLEVAQVADQVGHSEVATHSLEEGLGGLVEEPVEEVDSEQTSILRTYFLRSEDREQEEGGEADPSKRRSWWERTSKYRRTSASWTLRRAWRRRSQSLRWCNARHVLEMD